MRLVDIDKSIESVKNLIRNGATIEQALDAQPTAYDLEEVVEQLEELLETLSDGGDDWYTAEKINDAIEIVKGGIV